MTPETCERFVSALEDAKRHTMLGDLWARLSRMCADRAEKHWERALRRAANAEDIVIAEVRR